MSPRAPGCFLLDGHWQSKKNREKRGPRCHSTGPRAWGFGRVHRGNLVGHPPGVRVWARGSFGARIRPMEPNGLEGQRPMGGRLRPHFSARGGLP